MARICSSCGRANDDDAAFCASCGTAFPAAAPAPPQPPAAAPAPPPPGDVPVAQPPVAAPAPGLQPPAGAAPPPGAAAPGGVPPRKGPPAWAIVLIVLGALLAVAVTATAGVLLLWPHHDGGDHHPTPIPVITSTTSTNGSAGTAGYLVAGSGTKANRLTAIASDGSASMLATGMGNQLFQIAYSPDGSTIACIGGGWQRSQVWLYDVASGDTTPVDIGTPSMVAIDSIAWLSPSELLIAGFTTTPKTGDVAEFVVYDPAGGGATPLADATGAVLRGVSVSASRDGSKIAYVTYTDQKSNQYGMPTATERLELLDREAGTVTELGHDKALFDVNARRFDEPLISPDGTAIIYRRAGSDVGTEYTVVDARGTTLMTSGEVTFPAGYAWDPTSEKVVYTAHSATGNGGTNDPVIFYVFDKATGGGPQVIARYKGTSVQDLAWSPDGSTIAWSEYDRDQYQTGSIFLTPAGGGDAKFLYKGALTPAWAPGATVSGTPTDTSSP